MTKKDVLKLSQQKCLNFSQNPQHLWQQVMFLLFQVGLMLLFAFLSSPFPPSAHLIAAVVPGFLFYRLHQHVSIFSPKWPHPAGPPALLLDLLLYWMSVRFGAPFYPPRDLLLQGRLLIRLWAAVQCNTVDIRRLSQVDLKNGLKLMVLANKWHSLIIGKICLCGQLAGGHHTRSEPPGCSGRTSKMEKRPSRQGARQETCCTYWSLFPLTGNAWCERRVWSLDFGQRWAISVPVGPFQCVFTCGMCALVHVPI